MQRLSSDEISRLTPEERLSLIGQLWDSLDDSDLSLSTAQRAELARRIETFDRDEAEAISWEQLRAELIRRCPQ